MAFAELIRLATVSVLLVALASGLPPEPEHDESSFAPEGESASAIVNNKEQELRYLIFLKPAQQPELELLVSDAASPSALSYGKEFDVPKIREFVGHSDDVLDDVVDVLRSFQCSLLWSAPTGDSLIMRGCVYDKTSDITQAHELIRLVYTLVPAGETGLPPKPFSSKSGPVIEVSPVVDGLSSVCLNSSNTYDPTSELPSDRIQLNTTTASPRVMAELYDIPHQSGPCSNNTRGQAILMASFNQQAASDLQQWFRLFAPSSLNLTLRTVYNQSSDARFDIESALDVEWAMALGQFVPTDFFGGGSASSKYFLATIAMINSLPEPPLVLSISATFRLSPQERVVWDTEVLKAAARRLTLLISSGDSGAVCDIFTGKLEFSGPSHPFITVVGGTQLGCTQPGRGQELNLQEVGWSGSGGGFSVEYERPGWQDEAVLNYLALNTTIKQPPSHLFDPNGRGLPDVALLANNVPVVIQHELHPEGSGTSISTPAFAGIISLLNNERLAAGKTALGALNPFLYANPDAFNDIIEGTNDHNSPGSDCSGFYAGRGWDPVTGLGSPNYPKLLQAAMALP